MAQNPKSEKRETGQQWNAEQFVQPRYEQCAALGIRGSGFGFPSDFGIRISDFLRFILQKRDLHPGFRLGEAIQ